MLKPEDLFCACNILISIKSEICFLENRLNSFVHLNKGKDALEYRENKPHFLVPLDENANQVLLSSICIIVKLNNESWKL